ncbi:MAG: hypothetical protein J1E65_01065 [Lachnospiraceae bacterium]|nr:hypothetical protein [Lachnospiraceae bacterium]
MSEQSFFQNALSNFTHEVAAGGSIRHLTDLGYTVKQISEQISFPTPTERIRRQVWERLIETEVILTCEPGCNTKTKADYVREYDEYGRASFRKVAMPTAEQPQIQWKEFVVKSHETEKFRKILEKKVSENGSSHSYAACEFGILMRQEPAHFQELLGVLNEKQREYIEGLPWEPKSVYHRLNSRMLEILLQLSAEGFWRGECYFLKTGEKVRVE